MKKIFTLLMLSIFTLSDVNAEEEVLWEGDFYVTWANGYDASHKEWGGYNADPSLNQDISYHFTAGTKINVYLTTNDMTDGDNVYHKCQFDNWDWEQLPGITPNPVEFSTDTKCTFVVTEELATAVAAKGFRIHGHGFNVVKVTKGESEEEEVIADLDPVLLWEGDWATIDNWGASTLVLISDNEAFNIFAETLTTACNIYLLVDNVESRNDLRLSGMWGEWSDTTYPFDGYNHMNAIDGDNVVKIALTQDFVTSAFINQGGIAFWGNGGFRIKAIATTKTALLENTTGIQHIDNNTNPTVNRQHKMFNLNGQRVEGNYKGIVIIDGKKVYLAR